MAKARKTTGGQLVDDLLTMAAMPAAEMKRMLGLGQAAEPAPNSEAILAEEREVAREIEIAEERDV